MEKGQKRDTNLVVSDDVEESDDVWSTAEDLKDLDFSLDLLFLDWFKYFDDAFFVVGDVDALKHFRVLSPPNLPDNLIIVGVSVSLTKQQNTSGGQRTYPQVTCKLSTSSASRHKTGKARQRRVGYHNPNSFSEHRG